MNTESTNTTNAGSGPGQKKRLAQLDYEETVRRDYRRNIFTFCVVEFLWGLGLPFAAYTTMVPAYMTALNSPKFLIGIVAALFAALAPLQLLLSHWLRTRSRKKCIVFLWAISVVPWMLHSIVLLLQPTAFSDVVRLILFCSSMVVFAALIVGTSAIYSALCAECAPLAKRGSFWSYRLCALTAGILLVSPLAHRVMQAWPEPHNFLVCFFFGCTAYLLGAAAVLFVREHRNPQTHAQRIRRPRLQGLLAQIRLLVRKLHRDPNYRVFIFFAVLFCVVCIMGSFIIVFAREKLNLTTAQILPFTVIQFVSSTVATLILGKLADRIGYRIIGVIMGVLLTAGFAVIAAVSAASEIYTPGVYIAFILYSSGTMLNYMITVNLSMELRPRQDVGMLIGVTNSIMMPAVLIAGALSGRIIDHIGSYLLVFSLAAALGLIATLGFALLVREPRQRKMYVVKYIRRL